VRVYRHLDQLNPSSSLRAYLLTAYRNAAYNYIRATRAKKRDAQLVPEAALLEVETDEPTAEESIISREQVEQFRNALVSALTPEESALLMSRFVENLSNAEMAEILAVSPTVLRVRIHRALVKLKGYLAQQSENAEEASRATRK
jgi:RNA polymerase sigma-70 factor (ECF subfamily)